MPDQCPDCGPAPCFSTVGACFSCSGDDGTCKEGVHLIGPPSAAGCALTHPVLSVRLSVLLPAG